MADKTILDFPVLLDNLDADEIYVLRGTGTGRDRHQSRLNFLQDILLFGVPEHSLTREYAENTGMCQDEGMLWASSFVGVNVGNKPSTNQDKWNPVSAPTKPETIVVTGAFTTLYRHHHITSDTSGGNNTITLNDGLFDGQTVNVNSDGSGFTYLKGTGLYLGASSLGIPISDGLKCTVKWDSSLSKWIADNEVTADYIGTGQQLIQYSNGRYINIEQITLSFTAANSLSGTYPFSIAFASAPDVSYCIIAILAISTGIFGATNFYTQSLSNTGITGVLAQSGGSFVGGETATLSVTTEGDY